MIDAQFRSEERYTKLSIAYEGEEERSLVSSTVENIILKHKIQPQTYTSGISDNKEVLVIEYHDDSDREAGAIFEEMIKTLNIKECD